LLGLVSLSLSGSQSRAKQSTSEQSTISSLPLVLVTVLILIQQQQYQHPPSSRQMQGRRVLHRFPCHQEANNDNSYHDAPRSVRLGSGHGCKSARGTGQVQKGGCRRKEAGGRREDASTVRTRTRTEIKKIKRKSTQTTHVTDERMGRGSIGWNELDRAPAGNETIPLQLAVSSTLFPAGCRGDSGAVDWWPKALGLSSERGGVECRSL
jgi:hypothetical protein